MSILAVLVATAAAFVWSSAFYAVASPTPASTTSSTTGTAPWQIGVEVLRSAIVSSLVAGLLAAGGWGGPVEGASLGAALWALPAVLLAGSVTWEQVPLRSAGLHAGDWLGKLVLIGVILGLFR